jgi:dienelactone hydrolase
VSIPFEESVIPALMVSVGSPEKTAPCIVHFNGLDGVKEYLYLCGLPGMLGQRGVSILLVDNPGVGEALRKFGLRNTPEAEVPASACFDYLLTRADVDPNRIGMMALSLGGFHAPRATAFEPRFACCVAWGANHNTGKRFRARLAGTLEAQKSVPHYFDHVKWVLGKDSIEACAEVFDRFTLEGTLDRIQVPVYITHGADDRQIPVSEAHQTYEGCVNSPRKELRIFRAEEGGEQHCSIGNMSLATNAMADWIADVLKAS